MMFVILVTIYISLVSAQNSSLNGQGVCSTVSYNKSDGNEFCAFFLEEGLTWKEAAVKCQQQNARLPEIRSKQENEAIFKLKPKYNGIFPHGMWLGGTDLATEGTWLWESTKEPIIYTHWDTHSAIEEFKSQQPDNLGNENCLQMWMDHGKWNDLNCDYTKVPQITMCEKSTRKGKNLSWATKKGVRFLGTYQEMWEICKSQGKVLLELRSDDEQNELLRFVQDRSISIWMGLIILRQRTAYNWNSTGEWLSYSHWLPKEPAFYADRFCVSAVGSGNSPVPDFRWKPTKCEDSESYGICQDSGFYGDGGTSPGPVKNSGNGESLGIRCRSNSECLPGTVCLHSACSILPCNIDSRNCPEGFTCHMEGDGERNPLNSPYPGGTCRSEKVENSQWSAILDKNVTNCAISNDCPSDQKCFTWSPISTRKGTKSIGICRKSYGECTNRCSCPSPQLVCSGSQDEDKNCFCTHTDQNQCGRPCNTDAGCPTCQTCSRTGMCMPNIGNQTCAASVRGGACPKSPQELCLYGRDHECCTDCDCYHRSSCKGSTCDPCTRKCSGQVPWYCMDARGVCTVDEECQPDKICGPNSICISGKKQVESDKHLLREKRNVICNPPCELYEICSPDANCKRNKEITQAKIDSTCGSYRMSQHIMEEAKYFYNFKVNQNCHHYLPLPPWFEQPRIENLPNITRRRSSCPGFGSGINSTYPCSCNKNKTGQLQLFVGFKPVPADDSEEHSRCQFISPNLHVGRQLEIYCLEQWLEVKSILKEQNKGYNYFWTGMKLKVKGKNATFFYQDSGVEAPFADWLFPPPLEDSCVQIEYVKTLDDWKMSTRNCLDIEPAILCELALPEDIEIY